LFSWFTYHSLTFTFRFGKKFIEGWRFYNILDFHTFPWMLAIRISFLSCIKIGQGFHPSGSKPWKRTIAMLKTFIWYRDLPVHNPNRMIRTTLYPIKVIISQHKVFNWWIFLKRVMIFNIKWKLALRKIHFHSFFKHTRLFFIIFDNTNLKIYDFKIIKWQQMEYFKGENEM